MLWVFFSTETRYVRLQSCDKISFLHCAAQYSQLGSSRANSVPVTLSDLLLQPNNVFMYICSNVNILLLCPLIWNRRLPICHIHWFDVSSDSILCYIWYFLTTREAAWYINLVLSVCLSVCLVCLSVCMYVCQTITFESLDVGSSYLHMRYISTDYGSSSYMKVIVSRSRSLEPKRSEIPIQHCL